MISSDFMGVPIHPASPFWVINENRQRIFDVNASKGYSYLYELNHVLLVSMYRSKAEQVPFGELLTKARLDAGLSRAQLAKETGISENSLQRYEKAGLESDGQYPPGPKLAKLCFELAINPWMALFGCLDSTDFSNYRGNVDANSGSEHPNYHYMKDQYFQLLKDNDILLTAINLIVGTDTEYRSIDISDYIEREVKRISFVHEKYMELFESNGFDPFGTYVIPGIPEKMPFKHAYDYAGMRSDPNPEETGRSKRTTNEQAVDAASTETPRREDQ